MSTNSLQELDKSWIHPLSNWRDQERSGPWVRQSAQGSFVTGQDGTEILDAFAGLWCVNIGYGRDSVVEAAARQMRTLPYAPGYFGSGAEPTIRLAAALGERAPGDCSRVFFTLGGSDAVDTAIRLVRYYNNILGRPEKKHFIALERGFHGSSTTSSGLTAISAFHLHFDVPGPVQHHIPSPAPYRHNAGPDPDAIIAATLASFRARVAEIGADNVAAFICEPIQASGGVHVPPPGFLRAIRETCRELGVLFIADEVVTGFGRTGPLFACETEGVDPDLMTIAKGLTCGYVPMGAVLLSNAIYEQIADATPSGIPVGHGYTYSGHPVAAAVGLEVLRLYEEEGILMNGQRVGAYFQGKLQELRALSMVGDVRGRGLLAGVELVADQDSGKPLDPAWKVADRLLAAGHRNRILFRAYADGVIGLAPPLSLSVDEADLLIDRLRATIEDVQAEYTGSGHS